MQIKLRLVRRDRRVVVVRNLLRAFAPLREIFFNDLLGVSQDSINKHRDGAGQEQDGAGTDGEVPEHLALAGEADA